ncbi:hypothetical protein BH18ACT15_BH18ACT15_14110 [soil metagenome]
MDYLLLEANGSGRSELLEALEIVDEGLQAVLTQWDDLEDYRRRVLVRRLESRLCEVLQDAEPLGSQASEVVNLDESRAKAQLSRTEVRD